MNKAVPLLLTFALLAGCASLSPEEQAAACRDTDWQRFGENDGRLGVATRMRANKFQACADVGQPVDLAAYQAGRQLGLEVYCTVENGYRVGYEGRRYNDVCPPTSEPDFLQGLAQGRKERPILIRPSIGVGIGIGLFNGHRYWHRCRPYRRWHRRCW